MSGNRRAIPKDVEKDVLVASLRRCCRCYYIDGIKTERMGQLAHLGQDASLIAFDDLVWLCLEHHALYDTKSRQIKGFTHAEVRHHREELYKDLQNEVETESSTPASTSVESVGQSGGITAKEVTVNIGPSDEAAGKRDTPVIAWPKRAGAPRFRMSPGIDNGRLICDFKISDASPAPGGVEARWQGAGTQMEWTEPMSGNVLHGSSEQRYQMKATQMMPSPPADEATFEVRFNLEDGPHGGRWTWPMHLHESKDHWILDSHLGSGVHQPSLEDAW